MTIVACPRCRDQVTAPALTNPDALVRCPLCNEEYSLGEALRGAPPMLIVVSGGEALATFPAFGRNDADADLALAPAENTTTPTAATKPFVFEERPAPRRVAARPRPRAREKNPLIEILKIVAGGIVGLSIGQLILWWVPGLHLSQRDPLDLGTKLSPYVPWIIPASLRTTEFDDEDEDGGSHEVASSSSGRRSSSATRRSVRRPSDSQSMRSSAQSSSDHQRPVTEADASAGSTATDLVPLDANNNATISTSAGVRNAPVVSADELSAALAIAQSAWEEAESDQSPNALRAAFSELARCVTFADSNDEQVQGAVEAARGLLREVSRNMTRLDQIVSMEQPEHSAENFPGRLVTGRIHTVGPAGKMFLTELDLGGRIIHVVSVIDPRSTAREDDPIVVLGVEVAKPRSQLTAYIGEDHPILFSDLIEKMPAQSFDAAGEQPIESDPDGELESNPVETENEGASAAESNPSGSEGHEAESAEGPPEPPEPGTSAGSGDSP